MVPGDRTQESHSKRTAGSQVRVLDGAPGPSQPDHHVGRGVAILTGLALLLVLALWVSSAGGATGTDPADLEPAALAGAATPTDPLSMPDLSGLTLSEAEASLEALGLSDLTFDLEATWQASYRRPAGQILRHVPPAGQTIVAPLQLAVVVSEGGPVASFVDLPPDVRDFVATLPGFDVSQPLLQLETAAGSAYKNDDWLFGECAAVALAYRVSADASYLDRCFDRHTVSIDGTLVDGTRYTVWGLPPEIYPAPFPSGVIVIDAGDIARALGITTYAAAPAASSGDATIDASTLLISAGPWRSEIAVSPTIASDLGDIWPETLLGSIHPWAESGHLVVGLDPPLRWQRPGELPSRIAADYGPFRVVAGCVPNVTNVVCDPSGAISVEGVASQFDVSGVSIRIDADDVPRRRMEDAAVGASWELPEAWQVAPDPLTAIASPREVLSAGTYPLRAGGVRCAHMPENALRDLGPSDVLVTVSVSGATDAPPWPRPFDWSRLDTASNTDAHECADRPGMRAGIGSFNLDGVSVMVVVAIGDEAALEDELEVYRVLDSFEVAPSG